MSVVVAAAIGGAIGLFIGAAMGAIAMGILAASAWDRDDGPWTK